MVDKLFRRCIETGKVEVRGYPGEMDPERMHVKDSAEHFIKLVNKAKEEEKEKFRRLYNNRFHNYPITKFEGIVKQVLNEEIKKGLVVNVSNSPDQKGVLSITFDKDHTKLTKENNVEIEKYTGHEIEIDTNSGSSRISINLMNRGTGKLSNTQRENYEKIVKELRKDGFKIAMEKSS